MKCYNGGAGNVGQEDIQLCSQLLALPEVIADTENFSANKHRIKTVLALEKYIKSLRNVC